MIQATIYSMVDIQKAIKLETAKLQELMYEELNSMKDRITNMEDLIRIYQGRLVLDDSKNQQAHTKKKA